MAILQNKLALNLQSLDTVGSCWQSRDLFRCENVRASFQTACTRDIPEFQHRQFQITSLLLPCWKGQGPQNFNPLNSSFGTFSCVLAAEMLSANHHCQEVI